MQHRLTQIGNGASQFINACTPGGWSDESLSSRTWRMSLPQLGHTQHRGWEALRRVLDAVLRPLGPDHCRHAYLAEVARSQVPPALRGLL